ncbi:hypothetical protein V6U90_29765 [Micromonospora sp. CPCC 206060]|uniref:hypothetical protein n=1 Tax=Micromonospora sp. CPCC 206060 TaxID=3122406 RepID=UPI002FF1D66C
MGRQRTRPMIRGERVQMAGMVVVTAGLAVVGVLTLAGVITFSGWGEGTLTVRLVCGGLFTVLGLAGLAGAGARLIDGQMPVEPETTVQLSGPEAQALQQFGTGLYGCGGARGPHPGVGEF